MVIVHYCHCTALVVVVVVVLRALDKLGLAARAGAGTGACMLGCASAETDASGLPRLAYIQVVPPHPHFQKFAVERQFSNRVGSRSGYGFTPGHTLFRGLNPPPALNGEDLRVL